MTEWDLCDFNRLVDADLLGGRPPILDIDTAPVREVSLHAQRYLRLGKSGSSTSEVHKSNIDWLVQTRPGIFGADAATTAITTTRARVLASEVT